ncbi:hypothetical protein HanPSC8_Chr01g0026881 [Helianthus annuus]|nr:hypothetical protein HanPSC8_Chr01g0026881 [Helianthus annuus]
MKEAPTETVVLTTTVVLATTAVATLMTMSWSWLDCYGREEPRSGGGDTWVTLTVGATNSDGCRQEK